MRGVLEITKVKIMMSSPNLSPIEDTIDRVRNAMPVTEDRVARTIQTLSYAEIAGIRHNLTLYEQATNYKMEEKRQVRMTITTRNNLTDEAISTNLTSVLDMFSIGSHTDYKEHISGVRQIGFNLYEIVVKNESAKKDITERFGRASTARGSSHQDVFEFITDYFMGFFTFKENFKKQS